MSAIVSRRGQWKLLRAGNYLWLQGTGKSRVTIVRVSVNNGSICYEPLFGGRIPDYAKHMVEVYCEVAEVG